MPIRVSPAERARCDANNFCTTISEIRVDVHPLPANVIVPREAGLLHFGVRSTYIWGLQIGSILSRLTAVALAKAVYSDQD
jgi:tetrahydromethanopterin S-methyltransferase subunit F